MLNSSTEINEKTMIPLSDKNFIDQLYNKKIPRKDNKNNKIPSCININTFIPEKHNLVSENINLYEVLLTGKEFCIFEDMMLICKNNVIRIYKYDDNFKFKKYKVISNHYLLFLIGKREITKNVRYFFYKLLLNLIKKKVKKVESVILEIMDMVNVDILLDIQTTSEYMIFKYRNGETKIYNFKLEETTAHKANNRIIKDYIKSDIILSEFQKLEISNNKVLINYEGRSFKNEIVVKNIQRFVIHKDKIFIMCKESLKILHFS